MHEEVVAFMFWTSIKNAALTEITKDKANYWRSIKTIKRLL